MRILFRTRRTYLAFVVTALMGGATPTLGSHTTTFTGTVNDNWDNNSNWTDSKPNPTARAVIPAGLTARIYSPTQGVCDSLNVAGTVIIKNGAKLTITFDELRHSDVTGVIQIEKGGKLVIEDSLTITGDNGKITGLTTGGSASAIVSGAGTLTIAGIGAPRADSLMLEGLMEIKVALVNNAYVIANSNGNTLKLSINGKSGDSGLWAAEAGGKLLVAIGVIGGSDWELIDNVNSVIQFTSNCTTLSGDFTIKKGTLDIDANVDTTGNLTHESVSGTHPRIDVADTKYVEFGQ